MLGNILSFFRRHPRHDREARPLRESDSRPKLGLALSSGGARGLAHVGVLQVLEENGIEIHAIAGSSMGSYVGALWAAGFSGKALEELAEEMHDRRQLWKLADPIFPPMQGLFRGIKAREHLQRSLGNLHFEDLERQLFVVAVDIDSKARMVMHRGCIAQAVHASCAMPGVVAPVNINGHRCVDGGVIDPVPVGVLRDMSDVDRIIAVSVVPTFSDVEEGKCVPEKEEDPAFFKRSISRLNRHLNLMAPGNLIDTFRQSVRAAQIRIAHESCKRADLCLRPEHFAAPWHDYAGFRRYIDGGRRVAEENLDQIRALLKPGYPRHETSIPRLVGDDVA